MKTKGQLILLHLLFYLVEYHALVGVQYKDSVSDSPVLTRILQEVDAATSDDHLFNVTLKLLNSICTCMHETLKVKEDRTHFDDEVNTLQDDTKPTNWKERNLYKKIYSNICFNLQQKLAKGDTTQNVTKEDEETFWNTSNCGKNVELTTENVIWKSKSVGPILNNSLKPHLENILNKALIQTKDYHKYNVIRYNLFGKDKPHVYNTSKHTVIVILTLHPVQNQRTMDNKLEVSEIELNDTLYRRSAVDIDIIDSKYGPIGKKSKEHPITEIDTECSRLSIYTFLVESEKHNLTKVFKLLRRKGTIKIYVEVITKNNHTDYSRICCNKNSLTTSCRKDVIDEIQDSGELSKEDSIEKGLKKGTVDMKETISKIKNLVKLYSKRLQNLNKSSSNASFNQSIDRLTPSKSKWIDVDRTHNKIKTNLPVKDKQSSVFTTNKTIYIQQQYKTPAKYVFNNTKNPLNFKVTKNYQTLGTNHYSIILEDISSNESWKNSISKEKTINVKNLQGVTKPIKVTNNFFKETIARSNPVFELPVSSSTPNDKYSISSDTPITIKTVLNHTFSNISQQILKEKESILSPTEETSTKFKVLVSTLISKAPTDKLFQNISLMNTSHEQIIPNVIIDMQDVKFRPNASILTTLATTLASPKKFPSMFAANVKTNHNITAIYNSTVTMANNLLNLSNNNKALSTYFTKANNETTSNSPFHYKNKAFGVEVSGTVNIYEIGGKKNTLHSTTLAKSFDTQVTEGFDEDTTPTKDMSTLTKLEKITNEIQSASSSERLSTNKENLSTNIVKERNSITRAETVTVLSTTPMYPEKQREIETSNLLREDVINYKSSENIMENEFSKNPKLDTIESVTQKQPNETSKMMKDLSESNENFKNLYFTRSTKKKVESLQDSNLNTTVEPNRNFTEITKVTERNLTSILMSHTTDLLPGSDFAMELTEPALKVLRNTNIGNYDESMVTITENPEYFEKNKVSIISHNQNSPYTQMSTGSKYQTDMNNGEEVKPLNDKILTTSTSINPVSANFYSENSIQTLTLKTEWFTTTSNGIKSKPSISITDKPEVFLTAVELPIIIKHDELNSNTNNKKINTPESIDKSDEKQNFEISYPLTKSDLVIKIDPSLTTTVSEQSNSPTVTSFASEKEFDNRKDETKMFNTKLFALDLSPSVTLMKSSENQYIAESTQPLVTDSKTVKHNISEPENKAKETKNLFYMTTKSVISENHKIEVTESQYTKVDSSLLSPLSLLVATKDLEVNSSPISTKFTYDYNKSTHDSTIRQEHKHLDVLKRIQMDVKSDTANENRIFERSSSEEVTTPLMSNENLNVNDNFSFHREQLNGEVLNEVDTEEPVFTSSTERIPKAETTNTISDKTTNPLDIYSISNQFSKKETMALDNEGMTKQSKVVKRMTEAAPVSVADGIYEEKNNEEVKTLPNNKIITSSLTNPILGEKKSYSSIRPLANISTENSVQIVTLKTGGIKFLGVPTTMSNVIENESSIHIIDKSEENKSSVINKNDEENANEKTYLPKLVISESPETLQLETTDFITKLESVVTTEPSIQIVNFQKNTKQQDINDTTLVSEKPYLPLSMYSTSEKGFDYGLVDSKLLNTELLFHQIPFQKSTGNLDNIMKSTQSTDIEPKIVEHYMFMHEKLIGETTKRVNITNTSAILKSESIGPPHSDIKTKNTKVDSRSFLTLSTEDTLLEVSTRPFDSKVIDNTTIKEEYVCKEDDKEIKKDNKLETPIENLMIRTTTTPIMSQKYYNQNFLRKQPPKDLLSDTKFKEPISKSKTKIISVDKMTQKSSAYSASLNEDVIFKTGNSEELTTLGMSNENLKLNNNYYDGLLSENLLNEANAEFFEPIDISSTTIILENKTTDTLHDKTGNYATSIYNMTPTGEHKHFIKQSDNIRYLTESVPIVVRNNTIETYTSKIEAHIERKESVTSEKVPSETGKYSSSFNYPGKSSTPKYYEIVLTSPKNIATMEFLNDIKEARSKENWNEELLLENTFPHSQTLSALSDTMIYQTTISVPENIEKLHGSVKKHSDSIVTSLSTQISTGNTSVIGESRNVQNHRHFDVPSITKKNSKNYNVEEKEVVSTAVTEYIFGNDVTDTILTEEVRDTQIESSLNATKTYESNLKIEKDEEMFITLKNTTPFTFPFTRNTTEQINVTTNDEATKTSEPTSLRAPLARNDEHFKDLNTSSSASMPQATETQELTTLKTSIDNNDDNFKDTISEGNSSYILENDKYSTLSVQDVLTTHGSASMPQATETPELISLKTSPTSDDDNFEETKASERSSHYITENYKYLIESVPDVITMSSSASMSQATETPELIRLKTSLASNDHNFKDTTAVERSFYHIKENDKYSKALVPDVLTKAISASMPQATETPELTCLKTLIANNDDNFKDTTASEKSSHETENDKYSTVSVQDVLTTSVSANMPQATEVPKLMSSKTSLDSNDDNLNNTIAAESSPYYITENYSTASVPNILTTSGSASAMLQATEAPELTSLKISLASNNDYFDDTTAAKSSYYYIAENYKDSTASLPDVLTKFSSTSIPQATEIPELTRLETSHASDDDNFKDTIAAENSSYDILENDKYSTISVQDLLTTHGSASMPQVTETMVLTSLKASVASNADNFEETKASERSSYYITENYKYSKASVPDVLTKAISASMSQATETPELTSLKTSIANNDNNFKDTIAAESSSYESENDTYSTVSVQNVSTTSSSASMPQTTEILKRTSLKTSLTSNDDIIFKGTIAAENSSIAILNNKYSTISTTESTNDSRISEVLREVTRAPDNGVKDNITFIIIPETTKQLVDLDTKDKVSEIDDRIFKLKSTESSANHIQLANEVLLYNTYKAKAPFSNEATPLTTVDLQGKVNTTSSYDTEEIIEQNKFKTVFGEIATTNLSDLILRKPNVDSTIPNNVEDFDITTQNYNNNILTTASRYIETTTPSKTKMLTYSKYDYHKLDLYDSFLAATVSNIQSSYLTEMFKNITELNGYTNTEKVNLGEEFYSNYGKILKSFDNITQNPFQINDNAIHSLTEELPQNNVFPKNKDCEYFEESSESTIIKVTQTSTPLLLNNYAENDIDTTKRVSVERFFDKHEAAHENKDVDTSLISSTIPVKSEKDKNWSPEKSINLYETTQLNKIVSTPKPSYKLSNEVSKNGDDIKEPTNTKNKTFQRIVGDTISIESSQASLQDELKLTENLPKHFYMKQSPNVNELNSYNENELIKSTLINNTKKQDTSITITPTTEILSKPMRGVLRRTSTSDIFAREALRSKEYEEDIKHFGTEESNTLQPDAIKEYNDETIHYLTDNPDVTNSFKSKSIVSMPDLKDSKIYYIPILSNANIKNIVQQKNITSVKELETKKNFLDANLTMVTRNEDYFSHNISSTLESVLMSNFLSTALIEDIRYENSTEATIEGNELIHDSSDLVTEPVDVQRRKYVSLSHLSENTENLISISLENDDYNQDLNNSNPIPDINQSVQKIINNESSLHNLTITEPAAQILRISSLQDNTTVYNDGNMKNDVKSIVTTQNVIEIGEYLNTALVNTNTSEPIFYEMSTNVAELTDSDVVDKHTKISNFTSDFKLSNYTGILNETTIIQDSSEMLNSTNETNIFDTATSSIYFLNSLMKYNVSKTNSPEPGKMSENELQSRQKPYQRDNTNTSDIQVHATTEIKDLSNYAFSKKIVGEIKVSDANKSIENYSTKLRDTSTTLKNVFTETTANNIRFSPETNYLMQTSKIRANSIIQRNQTQGKYSATLEPFTTNKVKTVVYNTYEPTLLEDLDFYITPPQNRVSIKTVKKLKSFTQSKVPILKTSTFCERLKSDLYKTVHELNDRLKAANCTEVFVLVRETKSQSEQIKQSVNKIRQIKNSTNIPKKSDLRAKMTENFTNIKVTPSSSSSKVVKISLVASPIPRKFVNTVIRNNISEKIRKPDRINLTSNKLINTNINTKNTGFKTFHTLAKKTTKKNSSSKVVSKGTATKIINSGAILKDKNKIVNKDKSTKKSKNRNSFSKELENTNLYPINIMPQKTQRKILKRINLGNKNKEIMTMNTQDFFSQKRFVTPRNIRILQRENPMPMFIAKPVSPNYRRFNNIHLSKIPRPIITKPLVLRKILRPTFTNIDNAALSYKANNFVQKPSYIRNRNEDSYKSDFHPYDRPKLPSVQNQPNIPQEDKQPKIESEEEVTENPTFVPKKPEPKDVTSESIDHFFEYEDSGVEIVKNFDEPKKYFMESPEYFTKDSRNMPLVYRRFWSEEKSAPSTTTQRSRKRSRRTIFFLSPTESYDSIYF